VTRRGDYYVILPLMPELREEEEEASPLDREYSSGDDLLDGEGTLALLREHGFVTEEAGGAL